MIASPYDLIDGGYIEGVHANGVDFTGFTEDELRVLDSTFRQCVFDGASFEHGHLSDVAFEDCPVPDISFVDADLQDVVLKSSRLGGLQAYGSSWTRGGFESCKVTYINFRQARLHETIFADCTVDELDLTGATVKNVSFANCTINRLILTQANCNAVDLRGARIGTVTDIAGLKGTIMAPEQFIDLAPSFARLLGITVQGREN